ncbi:hypothetical protein Zmor_025183 [Zophobas morio]|uniref:Coiled-coil domain-containing protein n=1 Tax=Zophobas morio TaxID=2755281 RepID=A0AA38HRR9_9CUCU|nr:hypothetical protein Zmor_025183 [Zophobas morio]
MLAIGLSSKSTDKVKTKPPLTDFPERTNGHKITRKFVNSAIYIEKPLSTTVSSESCSIRPKPSNDHVLETKIKRCSCSVEQRNCPCHSNTNIVSAPKEERGLSMSSSALKSVENKPKIAQYSSSGIFEDPKKQVFKKWIAKKEDEKRRKEIEAKMQVEAKMKEREAMLELERNNFKKWLMNKKKIELEAKKKKEKEMEKRQLKELEKEKKQLENQLKFQLWLKKKEEAQLERKIKEQMDLINKMELKERQMRENEKAFQEWLKNSKHRQKPVPMNKGIETLYSSSVTYVNPNPWKSVA